jgi:hypothetical protein
MKNKRKYTLSITVTEAEMEAFNKRRREEEDKTGKRFSTSGFIRRYMFTPYIERNGIPDKPNEDPSIVPDSKPPTEHRAYPVI